ncbi:MAG: beta-ketoacyl-ACP synthase II [Maioricimonas sp. JB049]
MEERIFVSGLGAVTCLGNSVQTLWNELLAGRSGIRTLQHLDVSDLAITIGGEVDGIDASDFDDLPVVSARRMDRAAQFAVYGTGEALRQAGLPTSGLGERTAVVLGSGLNGLLTLQEQTERLLERGPRAVSPLTIPLLMPNAAAANVSLAYGAQGPTQAVGTACASSGHAILSSIRMLRDGDADVAITGGTEASLTRLGISAFANMRAMTRKYNDRPTEASRPFDGERDGFVMSEGAGILIIETESHHSNRGGTPLAEIVGFGTSTDAFHLVQPDESAAQASRSMASAISKGGLDPQDIAGQTYVNAHGTGTPLNDAVETVGLKNVFGKAAYDLQISSSKSMTGHMIGAAAGLESIVCIRALQTGILPPTINYKTPDPACDLDYVPNEPRKAAVKYALNNSLGFGGHNVCLLFGRVGEA